MLTSLLRIIPLLSNLISLVSPNRLQSLSTSLSNHKLHVYPAIILEILGKFLSEAPLLVLELPTLDAYKKKTTFQKKNSPWVILSDFGGAFAMGAVGGTVWHGIKGARNSPRGDRFLGSISAIKARAPVVGGNFGVWGGLFSSFDCAVKGYRQKEDPYNAIISGFLTGGTLAVRSKSCFVCLFGWS